MIDPLIDYIKQHIYNIHGHSFVKPTINTFLLEFELIAIENWETVHDPDRYAKNSPYSLPLQISHCLETLKSNKNPKP